MERLIRNNKAEELGGSDEQDWHDYEIRDERAYYDKPDHFKRSVRHQPNHIKAVKRKQLFKENVFDANLGV